MNNRLIPDDITEAEQKAGFQQTEIENPHGHYFMSEPTIPGVVCQIDPSDRVLKQRAPNGVVNYKHQRYGKWGFQREDEDAAWLPCGDAIHFFPDEAIAAAKAKLGQDCEPRLVVQLPGD